MDIVTEDKRLCVKVVCVSVGDGTSMCSVYFGVKCCILYSYFCTSYIPTATTAIKLLLDVELHLVTL